MNKDITAKDILFLNSIGGEILGNGNGEYYVKIPHSVLEYYHSLASNSADKSKQANNYKCVIVDKSRWQK